jgi:hypothetical protein
LKLLGHRFGALPEGVVARVNAADRTRIEQRGERLLTAPTLEAVLDDE